MIRKTLLATMFLLSSAALAAPDEMTRRFLDDAWPRGSAARLGKLGRGVGVVFSPDLSVDRNCRFYEALGFACFQDADWNRVLDGIRAHNAVHREDPIRTLVLETHGTNGNGLKLQTSYDPRADRSYVSVGALQERLEPAGIRYIIISACNSGRLLRPLIYRSLDPDPGDKLFLPPTCGIVNATGDWNPLRSRILVATPASSHIEATLACSIRELAPATRRALELAARNRGVRLPPRFAVSDVMMQMIVRDSELRLSTHGYVRELSGAIQPESVSETLFNSLLRHLDDLVASEARVLSK